MTSIPLPATSTMMSKSGSAPQRVGCRHCFYTLDPFDADETRREFVTCRACSAAYHASCGREACVQCGASPLVSFVVTAPPALIVRHRHPIAIPSLRALDTTPQEPEAWDVVLQKGMREISVYLPLIFFFVGLATLVGTVAYRILVLEEVTIQTILDSVLRRTPPEPVVFWLSLITGLLTAYVVFPFPVSNRLTRFVGSFILLMVLTLALLNLRVIDLVTQPEFLLELPLVRAGLIGEIFAFLTMIIVFPFYRRATQTPDRLFRRPKLVLKAQQGIAIFRYIGSVLSIALFAIVVSLMQMAITLRGNAVASRQDQWQLSEPLSVISLTCIGVALLLYHPPTHTPLKRFSTVQWAVRLCGGLLCMVFFALIYMNSSSAPLLIEATMIALLVSASLFLVPRALS